MKKILALLLALTCAVSLTACGIGQEVGQKKIEKKEKANFEEAVWEGYSEMSFMEFLEEGFLAFASWNGEDVEIEEVSYEEGWDESENLDEDDVSKKATAVTYILKVHNNGSDEDGTAYFFMECKNDNLSVEGVKSYIDDPDDAYEGTKDEAEGLLNGYVASMDKSKVYSAVWEKYDEMPLYDVVTKGLTNLLGEGSEISVSFKGGWRDTTELNEYNLDEGIDAVTMMIHMSHQDVNYFLEFDGTTFVVAGSEWISGDTEEFEGVESSESLLDELVVAVEE